MMERESAKHRPAAMSVMIQPVTWRPNDHDSQNRDASCPCTYAKMASGMTPHRTGRFLYQFDTAIVSGLTGNDKRLEGAVDDFAEAYAADGEDERHDHPDIQQKLDDKERRRRVRLRHEIQGRVLRIKDVVKVCDNTR